jgi:uncharacterized protein YjbI with pentapeptide repeats
MKSVIFSIVLLAVTASPGAGADMLQRQKPITVKANPALLRGAAASQNLYRYFAGKNACLKGSQRGYNQGWVDQTTLNGECSRLDKTLFGNTSLSGANLKGASLIDANLGPASLVNTDFQGAQLVRTGFPSHPQNPNRGLNLKQANLSGASLVGKFEDSDLGSALLLGTLFRNAELRQVNFSDVSGSGANFSGIVGIRLNFSRAMLESARFNDARLFAVDFRNANLKNSALQRAQIFSRTESGQKISSDLSQAVLSFANLTEASIEAKMVGINLHGAKLHNTTLVGSDMRNARLTQVDAAGANFSGVDLSGANLQHGNFPNARMIEANLQNADLRDTFFGGDCTSTNFRGADLRGASLDQCTISKYRALFERAKFDASTKLPFKKSRAKKLGMLEVR